MLEDVIVLTYVYFIKITVTRPTVVKVIGNVNLCVKVPIIYLKLFRKTLFLTIKH